jgi:tRNA-modifying protein YgfZ
MESYDAARSSCALFDVSTRGKIEVAGTEAAVFLHNLATNDIKTLAPNHGCETFFCTATAKVVAHCWVWRLPPEGKRDTFWLDLDPGLAEKTYQHLDRHLISEDVTLTDRTRELAQFHVAGPRLDDVLGVRDSLTVRRTEPLGLPGIDVLCSAEEAGSLRQKLLSAGAAPGDAATFDVLRVEAGTPLYGADMDETTFVAEVGRTKQAISYNKGCYLGQEPIVMARDRGVVQRTLVGLRLDEVAPPGSTLHRDGKEVGRTTSCVRSPRLGPIALAYVKRGNQAPGTALEVEANGQRRPATVAALPFG